MNIEKCLREYREKMARIAVIELELEGLKDEIIKSTGIIETDDETIEGMVFRRSEGGGGGNEVTSKTERVALKFRDEQGRLGEPQEVSYLYDEIRKRRGELKRLIDETKPIELALEGLNPKEKLIIVDHCVENYSWHEVATKWEKSFGYYVAERTCKNIKAQAYDKLKRILGKG